MQSVKILDNKLDNAIDIAKQALTLVEISNRLTTERFDSERRISEERSVTIKDSFTRLENANKDIRETLSVLVKSGWYVSGTIILLLLSIVGWFLTKQIGHL